MYVLLPLRIALWHDRAKAKEAGYESELVNFLLKASGKASAAGAKDGFVKLVIDKKIRWASLAHTMIGAKLWPEMIAEIVGGIVS